MIRNFIRISTRNILKNKGFTFINITGMAVGLAASLLILLWVQDELSFEKYNKDAKNIYRVEEDQFYSGERYHVTVTPYPSGPVIAVFVILIACINFINLSTAKAASRAREIGIKKVAGASRISMAAQFMLESLMLVTAALILAVILVGLFLGVFNNVSGKNFELNDLFRVKFILGFIATGLVAGIISGIYPAFYLSSFNPVAILKGGGTSGWGNGRLRQILVVIQFTLSLLIGIAAVFMYQQLEFMLNKDLGYEKKDLIIIQITGNMKSKYYSLKKELLNETLIRGVTASTWNPVSIGSLVVLSVAIAVPLGWMIVSNLLKEFPYRIKMNLLVFVFMAAAAIVIALFTVSYQAFRATSVNPAEALKVE